MTGVNGMIAQKPDGTIIEAGGDSHEFNELNEL